MVLRNRGGFEVEIAWQNGPLTEAVVRSQPGHPCPVHCGGPTHRVTIKEQTVYTLDGKLVVRQKSTLHPFS